MNRKKFTRKPFMKKVTDLSDTISEHNGYWAVLIEWDQTSQTLAQAICENLSKRYWALNVPDDNQSIDIGKVQREVQKTLPNIVLVRSREQPNWILVRKTD